MNAIIYRSETYHVGYELWSPVIDVSGGEEDIHLLVNLHTLYQITRHTVQTTASSSISDIGNGQYVSLTRTVYPTVSQIRFSKIAVKVLVQLY